MTSEGREFFDCVQEHEREWGTKSYPGRPSLAAIMAAKVVVFWDAEGEKQKEPDKITLHDDTADVEKMLLRSLFSREESKWRIALIFRDQKRLTIARLKIEFREAE